MLVRGLFPWFYGLKNGDYNQKQIKIKQKINSRGSINCDEKYPKVHLLIKHTTD